MARARVGDSDTGSDRHRGVGRGRLGRPNDVSCRPTRLTVCGAEASGPRCLLGHELPRLRDAVVAATGAVVDAGMRVDPHVDGLSAGAGDKPRECAEYREADPLDGHAATRRLVPTTQASSLLSRRLPSQTHRVTD